jgi:hypothetical protein
MQQMSQDGSECYLHATHFEVGSIAQYVPYIKVGQNSFETLQSRFKRNNTTVYACCLIESDAARLILNATALGNAAGKVRCKVSSQQDPA